MGVDLFLVFFPAVEPCLRCTSQRSSQKCCCGVAVELSVVNEEMENWNDERYLERMYGYPNPRPRSIEQHDYEHLKPSVPLADWRMTLCRRQVVRPLFRTLATYLFHKTTANRLSAMVQSLGSLMESALEDGESPMVIDNDYMTVLCHVTSATGPLSYESGEWTVCALGVRLSSQNPQQCSSHRSAAKWYQIESRIVTRIGRAGLNGPMVERGICLV